jgi:hypothetical protein
LFAGWVAAELPHIISATTMANRTAVLFGMRQHSLAPVLLVRPQPQRILLPFKRAGWHFREEPDTHGFAGLDRLAGCVGGRRDGLQEWSFR